MTLWLMSHSYPWPMSPMRRTLSVEDATWWRPTHTPSI
eukprot:CAMPEP_0174724060 /NCGR_PEP_ID=MMETSP1094-20130205/42593_1 /TAXON_ID=156173 /ORGANISM="Chrysochromulina brevifilum, Strain UTEX LB 985" /LENGTH=37 /DNA_ID= /DNA_START= /DNA_END= /DNA_ORIENTATION=